MRQHPPTRWDRFQFSKSRLPTAVSRKLAWCHMGVLVICWMPTHHHVVQSFPETYIRDGLMLAWDPSPRGVLTAVQQSSSFFFLVFLFRGLKIGPRAPVVYYAIYIGSVVPDETNRLIIKTFLPAQPSPQQQYE